jgi:formylglycine-generating enzyme required for sulfatase activity
MLDPIGFWSYARLDEQQTGGHLSQLRAIVGNEIGLQYGDAVTLWQDLEAIPYGADWAGEIERAIAQTTFYIPIVTPRFLKSQNCLDEFRSYRRRMIALGRDDLIFPVHYVDADHIRAEDAIFGDDLTALRRSQWIDFRPHFYSELNSPSVRRWAGDFAKGVMHPMRRSPAARAEPPAVVRRGAEAAPAGGGPEMRLAPLASRPPHPLSLAEEGALAPKDEFREGVDFPVMIVVPVGTFTMGSPKEEEGRDAGDPSEGPQHDVQIAKPFAVGKFPVTVDEFKAFVAETGHNAGLAIDALSGMEQEGLSWRDPGFAQTGSHPATCLSWNDATAYAKWLSGKTGKRYRLLSESEWEYVARGQTQPGNYPRYFFGNSEADFRKYGNGLDQTAQQQIPGSKGWAVLPCSDGYAYTSPVGSFRPNAFGLFDVAGNVWEWVEDAHHETYRGAPTDGRARMKGGATWVDGKTWLRVLRGGSWSNVPENLRAAFRRRFIPDTRINDVGFRLARTLVP